MYLIRLPLDMREEPFSEGCVVANAPGPRRACNVQVSAQRDNQKILRHYRGSKHAKVEHAEQYQALINSAVANLSVVGHAIQYFLWQVPAGRRKQRF